MEIPNFFKRQFTIKQIVFMVVTGVVGTGLLLMVFGVLPGVKYTPDQTVIEVWGIDSGRPWINTISKFQNTHGGVRVLYRPIAESEYEDTLINALAAGSGPDIFMFENNWITKHGDKIVPAPSNKMSQETLQALFPKVVEEEFSASGRIFALPLGIDTLALAYNRDLFDQGGVVFPPKTWSELAQQTKDLRVLDENGDLERGAFAIGGSSETVTNSTELIRVLLGQSGVELIDQNRGRAGFDSTLGRDIFEDYLSFANPSSSHYSWDNSFRNSMEAFAREEVAGVFVFSGELNNLVDRNAFLNIEVAPLPQANEDQAVNIADYWGLAVSSEATDPAAAWDFVIFATTNQKAAEDYMLITENPPALRILIDKYLNSQTVGIYAQQALTARGQIFTPYDGAVREVFDGVINQVLLGEIETRQALSRAASGITNLLK